MKRYWFYVSMIVVVLLATAACAPVQPAQQAPGERRVGDPTGRVINTDLSCVGHCSGYAESGNEWCFCDTVCPEHGNCCSDFETACPDLAR
ncbi:MAG: hypothetical protein AABX13_04545 [Nanoarchaeota archaeon]